MTSSPHSTQERPEWIRDARYIFLQSAPWTPTQECLNAACNAYDDLVEQLETERSRKEELAAEADALEAKLAETQDQLEAQQQVIEHVWAWMQTVAAEEGSYVFALADEVQKFVVSNPHRQPTFRGRL